MKTLSLKAKAVGYLSKREYSRAELEKKLVQQAHTSASDTAQDLPSTLAQSLEEQITQVLNDLERQGFLNDERFAQNLVHRKSKKFGTSKLVYELSQHKLNPETELALTESLKDSELHRCYQAWQQKFAHKVDASLAGLPLLQSKAKETRFLLQRGFAHAAVRRIVNGWTPEDE